MIVMKFGGSCISSKQDLENLKGIVEENLDNKPILVVSSLNNVTSSLKQMANELLLQKNPKYFIQKEELAKIYNQKLLDLHKPLAEEIGVDLLDISFIEPGRIFLETILSDYYPKNDDTVYSLIFTDRILSVGEMYSARLIAKFLDKKGILSKAFDSFNLNLITDSEFGMAKFNDSYLGEVKSKIKSLDYLVPVITGFIGQDESGNITTMGPNSSDDTAIIMGIAADANEILIYKKTNGVLAANDKLVENPKRIEALSYEEASELAAYGADVITQRAVELAKQYEKKVKILNFNDEEKFTFISEDSNNSGIIKGVANKDSNYLVVIRSPEMVDRPGYAASVYEVIQNLGISIDVIATSGTIICSTLDPFTKDRKRRDTEVNLDQVVEKLSRFGEVKTYRDKAILSLIGIKQADRSQVLYKTFKRLHSNGINPVVVSLAADSNNLVTVIEQTEEKRAVNMLYEEFFG